nr:MAG TPA: hypothetical protein [Caudoviricetes sp.]
MYKAPCLARTCWGAPQTLFYCCMLPYRVATFPHLWGNCRFGGSDFARVPCQRIRQQCRKCFPKKLRKGE